MNKIKQYNIKVIPRKWWEPRDKIFLWVDIEDAKKEAISQDFQIISEDKDIYEVEYWTNTVPLFYSKNISKRDVLMFFELFSNLNNLPITKQIAILKKQSKKYIMRVFFDELQEYIAKWNNLYEILSMDKWKKFFTHNQLELIRVWEKTSELNETIKNLAEEQKNELEVKSQLIMAAMYPIMILIALVAASLVLFLYILPKMMVLTWWIELPPLTSILFAVRNFIIDYGLYVAWFFFALTVLILILIKWESGRYVFHKVLLWIPWIKQLMKSRIEMQISKILEFSSRANMTPLDKVRLLYNWIDNLVYKYYFQDSIQIIEGGSKLINIFSKDSMFSAPMQWYIETWDINKNLDELMLVHYRTTLNNIQKNVKMVQMLLNTIILFLLGWVVGLFAWWVLQLVLKMTESVL